MSCDMMTFPKTVDEFMESYKVVDTDGIYMSKGAELVPIFRMKQWFEHLEYIERKRGKWIDAHDGTFYWFRQCNNCGFEREDCDCKKDTNFCPNCGADMRGEQDADTEN